MLYDVFNGDADGICALLQLRLEADAPAARLVSGVKRDIRLLERIEAAPGDRLTVLDVSLEANREGLMRTLAAGAELHWFDHHYAGEIPRHDRLRVCIDTSAHVCTSLLVDRYLGGALHTWAIVGAFGDALTETAARLAQQAGFDALQTAQLRELGELLNYNAYGESVADLRYPPEALYRLLKYYRRPFTFIAESQTFRELRDGFREDMRYAAGLRPAHVSAEGVVYVLPDTVWARRVSGVFANRLAAEHPARAVAVLTARPESGYVVSVRAPMTRPEGADALCRQFESGGGRKAAAGINHLPEADVERFLAAFAAVGWAAG